MISPSSGYKTPMHQCNVCVWRQVGGVDVSDFTHEEAVEAIRRAGDRVELLVQSPQVTHLHTNNNTLNAIIYIKYQFPLHSQLSAPVNCHEEDNLSKTNDQSYQVCFLPCVCVCSDLHSNIKECLISRNMTYPIISCTSPQPAPSALPPLRSVKCVCVAKT